jgi:hypothetical protein
MVFLVMLSVAARSQTAIFLTVSLTWAFPGTPGPLLSGLRPLKSQLTRSSEVSVAVPFSVSAIMRSNRIALLDSDISMQPRGLTGTSFSIVIILQGPILPLESQSACITVSVILQRMTGNRTPSRIHTILPSLGTGVAYAGYFIQHPSCGVSSYPATGFLRSSQLYARKPVVGPALASSSVKVTMT